MSMVKSHMKKQSILFWFYWKVNGTWDNNISEFPNGEKAIVEQILASEEIK